MSLKRDKKIIEEWKQVGRMKQLNQKLYDELDVALMYTRICRGEQHCVAK